MNQNKIRIKIVCRNNDDNFQWNQKWDSFRANI